MAHCGVENDYSAERPKLCYADGGRYVRVSFARSPAMEWNQEMFPGKRGKRGNCRGFSFGSRRRMLDKLNQVSVGAVHPDFLTMTLPDDVFVQEMARFGKEAKSWMRVFLKRLDRACPSACGFWRIEWVTRKSGLYEGKLFPHFHLLVWGLPQRDVGLDHDGNMVEESFVPVRDCQLELAAVMERVRQKHEFATRESAKRFSERVVRSVSVRRDFEERGDVRQWMNLFDWVSLAWYDVVGSSKVKHFLAGVRVEKIRTWGGVLAYCAKYMSKADSENCVADVEFGRSWGIFNRSLMPWAKMVELDLTNEMGNRIRRVARRYLEHRLGRRVQRHWGITVYCDVARFKRLWAVLPYVPF